MSVLCVKCCFIALILTWSSALRGETLKVETLKAGEMIRVTINSIGCFHADVFMYEIRGGDVKDITNYSYRFHKKPGSDDEYTKEQVKDSQIPLSPEDVRGLDALFVFYREPPPNIGGSTTIDRVEILSFRGEEEIGREKFEDSSGWGGMMDILLKKEIFLEEAKKIKNWEIIQHMIPMSRFRERVAKPENDPFGDPFNGKPNDKKDDSDPFEGNPFEEEPLGEDPFHQRPLEEDTFAVPEA